ncbi:MAG: ISL3 family transposase [Thermoleophilaceae bacterium]|nr:ISL3 family transposase [Thermoleophilaceae bacterium]
MRVTAAFSSLLCLEGAHVRDVRFEPDRVVVLVTLRRRRLVCSRCSFSTPHRHDIRPVDSDWRHLDLGVWRLEIRARLRRLVCPTHGVLTEQVPFARVGSDFTLDFEALVAWLATRTDKTTITRLVRIHWRTVGRIIERVCADELDRDRLDDLFAIGIDEVSWRKGHRYLTLVADHHRRQIVWGAEGASAKVADAFYEQLGPERSAQITAVSMDMGPGYAKSTRANAPQAVVCIDSFHVAKLGGEALDEVRREYWNELRALGDPDAAKRFKDARWALLKRPEKLTDQQSRTLRALKAAGGKVARAYELKEALRGIFAPGLTVDDVNELLTRFCSRASRSRMPAFLRLARTIRRHRDGILAAIRLGITNARSEALNNKVRLVTRRAYGFHSANAALALVMLTCGPITLQPPHELHLH